MYSAVADVGTASATAELHRGVNISSWLANAPRQTIFSSDFDEIKDAGFDNVRIPAAPEYRGFEMAPEGSNLNTVDFSKWDAAINLALKSNLKVVFALEPEANAMKTLENNPWAQDQFVQLWRALAQRYANLPVDRVVFELLNEPNFYNTADLYMTFIGRAAAAVHAITPGRLLLIDAPRGASIDGLTLIRPLNEKNVQYVFHFYEPYIFTHQGATWGTWSGSKQSVPYFSGVPYPSSKADLRHTYFSGAPNPVEAEAEIVSYSLANWNEDRIARRIDTAAAWAKENHAKVVCTEFGAYLLHADQDSRYRWIRDVRVELEHHKIAWDSFDYTDSFGIVDLEGPTNKDPHDGLERLEKPAPGRRHIQRQAKLALGLIK